MNPSQPISKSGARPARGSNPENLRGAAAATDENSTFTLRVINTISYKETKLSVAKRYTINDVQRAYLAFESHPEYYLWKDMYGRILDPNKTLVENGLVARDEVVEFDGIGKQPCILLVFKDGFENDPTASLNPLHSRKDQDKLFSLCRNY